MAKPRTIITRVTIACAVLWLVAPAVADPLALHARSVPLDPNHPSRTLIGGLEYRGGLVLRAGDSRFGGLSGLEVSVDGARMTAVSDRGYWIEASLDYDADGRLAGVADGAIHALRDETGRPLAQPWNDAEEIAPFGDGRRLVAFEHIHRIWIYGDDPATARARALWSPPGLAQVPANGGVEALARLADGAFLAVTEKSYLAEGVLRGWLISADFAAQRPLAYAVAADFHPTAFATLPNGDVLALERRFTLVSGPGARLLRIPRATIVAGAVLEGRLVASLAAPLTVDNMEGLALRRDANGGVLVYLVSDDNYSTIQRTLLMMFRLIE